MRMIGGGSQTRPYALSHGCQGRWIPAFAGMTVMGRMTCLSVVGREGFQRRMSVARLTEPSSATRGIRRFDALVGVRPHPNPLPEGEGIGWLGIHLHPNTPRWRRHSEIFRGSAARAEAALKRRPAGQPSSAGGELCCVYGAKLERAWAPQRPSTWVIIHSER